VTGLLGPSGSGKDLGGELALDIAVVAGSFVLALVLGALTLRRRTP
jgi:hypothetical protein